MNKIKRHTKRVLIGLAGGIVLLIGIVLIPYPGPGWLIVFAGLAILATEFAIAAHVLEKLRGFYDSWVEWLKRQHWIVRIIVLALTAAVVIVTIWLINGFGIVNELFDIGLDWLNSPIFGD